MVARHLVEGSRFYYLGIENVLGPLLVSNEPASSHNNDFDTHRVSVGIFSCKLYGTQLCEPVLLFLLLGKTPRLARPLNVIPKTKKTASKV